MASPDLPALVPDHGSGALGEIGPAHPPSLRPPLTLGAVAMEPGRHFWDYWRILARHRWTVITFFLASVIVGTAWTFTSQPIFSATATLRIEKEEPKVLKFEDVVKTDAQQDYYQTQFKVLQSRSIAHRVIGALQLDTHPEFQEESRWPNVLAVTRTWARERLVQWMPVAPPQPAVGGEDLIAESPITRAFQERLSVEPVRNARLVRVSFESRYADVAARIANTIGEAFIAQHLDQKIEATRYASQFLAKQIEEAGTRLEAAEGRMNRFLTQNNILFVNPDKFGDRQDLTTQQLTILSESLLRARNERTAKDSVVAQAARDDVESLPAVLQNPLVAKLKEEVIQLEGQYRKLGQTFKPEYPRMQRLEQNIAEVRRQLQAEVRRVVEALHTEQRAAEANERAIEKNLDQQRGLARQLVMQMSDYQFLRREVDTSRDLYTALLTRLKETQIASSLVTSNISIVDRAEVPAEPARPKRTLTILLVAIMGALGGVGAAFVFHYLDTNIKDAREVEHLLHVPTLALVPSRYALESRRERRRRLSDTIGDDSPMGIVAHGQPDSALAETFRNLRTSLLYSAPEHPPRTLMVTSLHPEDGKTSVATNLAITLAQLGKGEILLIDGDMRRPALHGILGIEQAPGLSTFLTGQAELPAVIVPTAVPNLYLLPAGRVPLNPGELLASVRLGQALEALMGRFTHIVFDAPPLISVSDALILAPRLEGVILVLRDGRAGREEAKRGIDKLGSVRARLLGVVLNDVDLRGSEYYGYYYGERTDGRLATSP